MPRPLLLNFLTSQILLRDKVREARGAGDQTKSRVNIAKRLCAHSAWALVRRLFTPVLGKQEVIRLRIQSSNENIMSNLVQAGFGFRKEIEVLNKIKGR